MKVIGVIPARYASVRFPGKPLALIAGKPLLQWVIEASKNSKLINQLAVATDDERIFNLAKDCGAEAVMTDSNLTTGTDRVWQAADILSKKNNQEYDIVLNIQGDEPLINGEILDVLVKSMIDNPNVEMSTLAHPVKNTQDLENPNTVKVIMNKRGEAIYFSRFPIPFSRNKEFSQGVNLQHIGLYGYKKAFLKDFCKTPAQPLEFHESLEQLRALYMGAKIQVTSVECETRGVDSPEDVLIVEQKLLQRNRLAN